MATAIGIVLEKNYIAAVRVDGNARSPQVSQFAAEQIPPPPAHTDEAHTDLYSWRAEQLDGFLKRHKLPRLDIFLAPANEFTLLRQFSVPFLAEEQIKRTIVFEAEAHIHSVPIDDLLIQHKKIGERGTRAEVLVSAVRRDAMTETIRSLSRVGVDPIGVDTSAGAAINALSNLEVAATEGNTLFIDIGVDTTTFMMMNAGQINLVRTVKLGIELPKPLSANTQAALAEVPPGTVYETGNDGDMMLPVWEDDDADGNGQAPPTAGAPDPLGAAMSTLNADHLATAPATPQFGGDAPAPAGDADKPKQATRVIKGTAITYRDAVPNYEPPKKTAVSAPTGDAAAAAAATATADSPKPDAGDAAAAEGGEVVKPIVPLKAEPLATMVISRSLLLERPDTLVKRLILEIRRTLATIDIDQSVARIRLSGAGDALPMLTPAVRAAFPNIEVDALPIGFGSQDKTGADVLSSHSQALLAPYGLALKGLGIDHSRAEFRRGEFASGDAFDQVKLPLAVCVSLLALLFLAIFYFVWRNQQNVFQLKHEIDGVAKIAYEDAYDPVTRSRPNPSPEYTELQKKYGATPETTKEIFEVMYTDIEELRNIGVTEGSPQFHGALEVWVTVQRALGDLDRQRQRPNEFSIRSIEIKAGGRECVITGRCDGIREIEFLMRELGKPSEQRIPVKNQAEVDRIVRDRLNKESPKPEWTINRAADGTPQELVVTRPSILQNVTRDELKIPDEEEDDDKDRRPAFTIKADIRPIPKAKDSSVSD